MNAQPNEVKHIKRSVARGSQVLRRACECQHSELEKPFSDVWTHGDSPKSSCIDPPGRYLTTTAKSYRDPPVSSSHQPDQFSENRPGMSGPDGGARTRPRRADSPRKRYLSPERRRIHEAILKQTSEIKERRARYEAGKRNDPRVEQAESHLELQRAMFLNILSAFTNGNAQHADRPAGKLEDYPKEMEKIYRSAYLSNKQTSAGPTNVDQNSSPFALSKIKRAGP